MTGVVKRLEDHPVRRLFDAGVPITLNTDDPAMFRCTLQGEYALAARAFGFSEAELRGIAENGFRYAFAASDAWDRQIASDVRSGKLDKLAARAQRDYQAGKAEEF